jgi:hypothetical protein
MPRQSWIVLLLSGLGLLLSACAQGSKMGPEAADRSGLTEQIHQDAIGWLDRYLGGGGPEELAPLAEKIIARLMGGGHLYVTGDPGFCDELNFRAGGLSAAKIWPQSQELSDNDVLLIGYFDENSKVTRLLLPAWIGQSRGNIAKALTVRIGSARWPLIAKPTLINIPAEWPGGLYLLDTDAPETDTVARQAQAQFRTVALTMALEGEIIAAATRRGRTVGVLASLGAPNGGRFDAAIRDMPFVDDLKLDPVPEGTPPQLLQVVSGKRLDPIPAGQLARQYLTVCRKEFASFLADPANLAQVRAGAERLAACQKRGGTIFTVCGGHILAHGAAVPPELTRLLVYGNNFNWEKPFPGIEKNDTLLYMGYLGYPETQVKNALAAGADAVTMCVADGPKNPRVTLIHNTWERWDAVVDVPGYPYKALATSGLHHTLVWYSLMAETQAMMHGGN